MNIDYLIENIRTLTIDDFNLTKDFYNEILPNLNNLIGIGTLGNVYQIDDKVVKVIDPCNNKLIGDRYCLSMKDDNQIYHIPHDKKNLILIANYLSEGIIGGILNEIPHFVHTYGMYFSKFYNTSYLISEKISTNFQDIIKNKQDVYLLMFQVAYALSIAQQSYKFTHYDLHIKNIGYILGNNKSYQYNLYGNILYFRPKFYCKIFDFEFSRLENDKFIVNPKFEDIIDSHSIYNPYYDFMSFIGSLYYHGFDRGEEYIQFNFFDLLTENEVQEIFNIVFNNNMNVQQILNKYYDNDNMDSSWRPKDSDIENQFNDISFILKWLLDKLNVDIYNENFNTKMLHRKLFINDYYDIDYGIKYYTGSATLPLRPFNFIKTKYKKFQNEKLSYESQDVHKNVKIHIIHIDQDQVLNNGYNFKSICCKMDPIVFLENDFGVAINGGFFDVNNTYEMVGAYKQFSYQTNNAIPKLYKDYYGYIIINEGRIDIKNLSESKNVFSNDEVFMSGPLLIYDGQDIIDDNTMNKIVKDVKIFQCETMRIPSDEKIINGKYNCDLIKPGELSHGSNPNPRSMLIITDNSNIILTTMEGRKENSIGVDFLDMIELAHKLGAKHAINLDGGQSSNIAWRSFHQPDIIEVTNHLNPYPVGNIIGLIKST